MSITEKLGKAGIPGFRSGKKWKMLLASIGYLFIFRSTKKNPEKSQGLNYLKWVAENIPVPYVAIGGIKETNILQVKKHGGKCYAMISELAGAASIKDKVSAIRRLLA